MRAAPAVSFGTGYGEDHAITPTAYSLILEGWKTHLLAVQCVYFFFGPVTADAEL